MLYYFLININNKNISLLTPKRSKFITTHRTPRVLTYYRAGLVCSNSWYQNQCFSIYKKKCII